MHLGNQPLGHYTEWPLLRGCFCTQTVHLGPGLTVGLSSEVAIKRGSTVYIHAFVEVIVHVLLVLQTTYTYFSLNPCSYSGPLGNWSDFGCRLRSFNTLNQTVTCECDHLTNFAILLVSGVRVNQKLKSICVEFGPGSYVDFWLLYVVDKYPGTSMENSNF